MCCDCPPSPVAPQWCSETLTSHAQGKAGWLVPSMTKEILPTFCRSQVGVSRNELMWEHLSWQLLAPLHGHKGFPLRGAAFLAARQRTSVRMWSSRRCREGSCAPMPLHGLEVQVGAGTSPLPSWWQAAATGAWGQARVDHTGRCRAQTQKFSRGDETRRVLVRLPLGHRSSCLARI